MELTKERNLDHVKEKENIGEKNEKISNNQMRKELTVKIEIDGDEKITPMQVIRTIRLLCGGILACTPTGVKTYEITLSNEVARDRLLEGFRIGDTRVVASQLRTNEMIVSFLHLPSYIEDKEILEKISCWGVTAVSPIRRRVWPGTNVFDGTRFLKVRFNEDISSLPYSTKFLTENGARYYRVIHDRQAKVCRLCLSPDHILRECPDFLCNRCKRQGHYARECRGEIEKCVICFNKKEECICNESSEESDSNVEERAPVEVETEGVSEEELQPGQEAHEDGADSAQEIERTPKGVPMKQMQRVFGVSQGPAKGSKPSADATPELAGGVVMDSPTPGESGHHDSHLEERPGSLGQKPMPQRNRLSLKGHTGASGVKSFASDDLDACLESQKGLLAAPSVPDSRSVSLSITTSESEMEFDLAASNKRQNPDRCSKKAKKKVKPKD